jgi:glycosyltransferase involved in cell wall biosynthesis
MEDQEFIDKNMKILKITAFGYADGGIENGLLLTQPLFEKRGHTVRVFASDLRPDLPHFNEYTYKTPHGFMRKIFYSFNPYSYRALEKVLKEFQPDVVHVHTVDQASPSVFFLLKKYPTILSIHGPEPFTKSLLLWVFADSNFKHGRREVADLTFVGKLRYAYHRYIDRPLYRLGLRNVDAIVTLSNYMHNLMEEEGLKNIYVPNGTTLFKYQSVEQKNIGTTLLYVGRLETYKGIDYLIKALPILLQKFPSTKLYIAGDGNERQSLKKLTDELHLEENVEFLGQLNRVELEAQYKQSTVVVMPSIWPEAFGKIGIEAMSVGRPVVATNVGGISDWLIDGENGFLVRPADSQALATAITRLFSDSQLYLYMMKKARETVEKFDLEKHVGTMERIYTETASHSRKKNTQ